MPEIPAEYRVRCENYNHSIECQNYADTRTGGDMNPYGPVTYKCAECIDDEVAAYYG